MRYCLLAEVFIMFLIFSSVAFAAEIYTTDAAGNRKTSFFTNDTIYMRGNVSKANTPVRIYTIYQSTTLTNNTNLTDVGSGYKEVTSDASGFLPITTLWASPRVENYGIVADFNNTTGSYGIYEDNVDIANKTAFSVTAAPIASIIASLGPSMPANHNWDLTLNGSNRSTMMQIRLATGTYDSIKINSLSFAASGTGNDNIGIKVVELYNDTNANGIYDPGDTLLAYNKYSADNGVMYLTITDGYVLSANTTVYWIITYTMTNSILNGETFNFQLASISATAVSSGATPSISGPPLSSAVKTVLVSATTTTTATTQTTTSLVTTTSIVPTTVTVTPTTTPTTTTTPATGKPSGFNYGIIALVVAVIIFAIAIILFFFSKTRQNYQYKFKPEPKFY